MARVSYVSREKAPDGLKPVYDNVEKKLGTMLNMFKALAHSPDLFQKFLAFDAAFGKTQLDGSLRELAYLKTSQINDCEYCLHYHRALGQKNGLNERQVKEIGEFETSDAYDDRQRDVMRFADQVTRTTNADERLVESLKSFLTEPQLVDLAMTVALANFTNRINNSLKIELP